MAKPRKIKHSKGGKSNPQFEAKNAVHALMRSVGGNTREIIPRNRVQNTAANRGIDPGFLVAELNRQGFRVSNPKDQPRA